MSRGNQITAINQTETVSFQREVANAFGGGDGITEAAKDDEDAEKNDFSFEEQAIEPTN